MQRFNVPITLPEQVTVGHRFHVRPLLPLLAADGQFYVCTITEDQVRLSLGSRFGMTDLSLADLPDGAHDDLDDTSDYENPLQASPVARTHTGHINIPNAQVYGSSPPEWRKGRVGVYVDRAAVVVDDAVRADPAPVVLIASPELAGHFAKASTLGALLVAAGQALDGDVAEVARQWPGSQPCTGAKTLGRSPTTRASARCPATAESNPCSSWRNPRTATTRSPTSITALSKPPSHAP